MYSSFNLVDAYTYIIMAFSATGGLLACRYGFTRLPYAVTFVVAPFTALYQKKEADFNHTS